MKVDLEGLLNAVEDAAGDDIESMLTRVEQSVSRVGKGRNLRVSEWDRTGECLPIAAREIGVALKAIGEDFSLWPERGNRVHVTLPEGVEGVALLVIEGLKGWALAPTRTKGLSLTRCDRKRLMKRLTQPGAGVVKTREMGPGRQASRLEGRLARGEIQGRMAAVARDIVGKYTEKVAGETAKLEKYWESQFNRESPHFGEERLFDRFGRAAKKLPNKRGSKGGSGVKMSPLKASCSKVVVAAMKRERAMG